MRRWDTRGKCGTTPVPECRFRRARWSAPRSPRPSARRGSTSWSPSPASRTVRLRPAASPGGTARRSGRAPTPRAGASPSDVPPCASSTARVSACLLSACAAVPSNAVIARQPPVMVCSPMCLGGGEVDAGLGLVGQPDHGRPGAGLDDGAQRGGAGGEVGERPRLVARGLGDGMHPHAAPG